MDEVTSHLPPPGPLLELCFRHSPDFKLPEQAHSGAQEASEAQGTDPDASGNSEYMRLKSFDMSALLFRH